MVTNEAHFSNITVKTIYQRFSHKVAAKASWHRNCVTVTHIEKERVPIIIINDTMFFFLKLQSEVWQFETITVSEYCLMKFLPYILLKNILIF